METPRTRWSDRDSWRSCDECGEEFRADQGHDCEVMAFWCWLEREALRAYADLGKESK